MEIGERIKLRRKELGISAEQVAEMLGVSPATIYRYESSDIANMRIDKLEPIAKVLHTTPAYLMGWEDNLETDTDFIAEMMKDSNLIKYVQMLLLLDQEKKKTVYDMIEFLSKKEGP